MVAHTVDGLWQKEIIAIDLLCSRLLKLLLVIVRQNNLSLTLYCRSAIKPGRLCPLLSLSIS